MTALNISGFRTAESIPAGATIVKAYWCLAGHDGPGEALPSEADAIRAGIHRAEQRSGALIEQQGYGNTAVERFSVDLRWKLRWQQGAPDPDGRPTVSCGIEATITRTTYTSLAEAREHLARIEKYAGVGQ